MRSKKEMPLLKRHCVLILGFAMLLLARPVSVSAATPDPVLEWVGIMNDTVLAGGTNPLITSRVVALVSSSVFDAVNGIEERYQPIRVTAEAPRHASERAAAIQAAYAILLNLYPPQSNTLTMHRDASITGEKPQSIAAGIAWGQEVADSIWAWRSTDGFNPPPPPFVGVLGLVGMPSAIGVWRPTPLLNAPGAGPQFASMMPWTMKRPSQFRPAPPPALASATYTADYNETKAMGAFSNSPRTPDQSDLALFWAGNTALYWNRIASQIATARNLSLSENAHLFAQMNLAMADAAIACWDAKYRYVFWRPITAIRGGDTDGNDGTAVDPNWTPWLDALPSGTPAHPEYPSGHSTVSGAAAFILAAAFGDNTAFTVTSEIPLAKTNPRSFSSFSAATAEIADARVFGGIHCRNSCVQGNAVGGAVADYVLSHAMRSGHEHDEDHW
jgi:membrane-associated phospholipid phosphatase